MSLTVTHNAAEKVRQHLGANPEASALRVNISATGCSGYMYELEFVEKAGNDDVSFESNGVTLVVAQRDLPFIDGTELDYRQEGLNEGFAFDTPNARNVCGCGESFQV